MKKVLLVGLLFLSLLLTSCSSLDVVQKDAIRAFSDVQNMMSIDSNGSEWQLESPDGTAVVNWNRAQIQIRVDSTPFVNAGLDISKLAYADENGIYFVEEFAVSESLGESAFDDFRDLVSVGRDNLSYHMEMDHYNIDVESATFEWAKNMNENNKDIVFVLDPKPLIAAGVDPDAVDGWVFEKVMMHVDGKVTEVDKLLKPFDLKS